MKNNLPSLIELVNIISSDLNTISGLFKKNSEQFVSLRSFLYKQHNYLENLKINPQPQITIYLQLLVILTLVDFANDLIKKIVAKNDKIEIYWKNGLKHTFEKGIITEDFKKFLNYFNYHCLKLEAKGQLNLNTIEAMESKFINCSIRLKETIEKINIILDNLDDLRSNIKKDITLLFIVLESLPEEQLNSFFINFQKHLPQDLELKNSNNYLVNVASLFQTSSHDIKFLYQKLELLFNLYFKVNNQEVVDATDEEGVQYLLEIVANQNIKNKVSLNLKALLEQFFSRSLLYIIFVSHLKSLLNK